MKDYLSNKEEFGFERIIERIYNIMNKGNSLRILINGIIYKTKINLQMEKSIEMNLKEIKLLNQTIFDLQKEKTIKETTKLYDNMFSIVKTALACILLKEI